LEAPAFSVADESSQSLCPGSGPAQVAALPGASSRDLTGTAAQCRHLGKDSVLDAEEGTEGAAPALASGWRSDATLQWLPNISWAVAGRNRRPPGAFNG